MKKMIYIISIGAIFLFLVSCVNMPPATINVSDHPAPSAVSLYTVPPSPSLSPSPAVETASPPEDKLAADTNQYSFAWFSDPQFYTKYHNGVFEKITSFLAENRQKMNLAYIIFTGDFVHNTKDESQWNTASLAMEYIDDLPNGVCSGNHDVGTKIRERNYTFFCKYFGEWRYRDKPWYGGSYNDNKDHFDLIDAGNTQYLFLYLGYQVDPDDLEWACSVCRQYPLRIGILCTHDYFNNDCTLSDYGKQIHDSVVAKCPNIYTVLCGHRYNSNCIAEEFDDDSDGMTDRTVLQMICNYQAIGSESDTNRTGGDGYFRIFKIDEDAGLIYFTSYSPLLDDFVYFDDPIHQTENYSFDASGEEGILPIPWSH